MPGCADDDQVGVLLRTERLVLRRFTAEDAGSLYDLNSDPEVMRYINGGEPTPLGEVRDRILPRFLSYYERPGGLGYWAAETRSAGEFLGWFHFRPGRDGPVELGYRLRRAAWNRGYATEGARAVLHKGFTDLGVERVVAGALTVNVASRRVLEKCGMVLLRICFPDWLPAMPGAEHGVAEYELTRDEWQRAQESVPDG